MKYTRHIMVEQQGLAVDILSTATGLSKSAVKNCQEKGAVWLKRTGKKEQRLRKAKSLLLEGDKLSLYHDSFILDQPVPEPQCIYSDKQFSIWYKPAGLLSQGTRYGDHCSLMRVAQIASQGGTTIHLVHRLDREAHGLVLLAHNRHAAAKFSELFRTSGEIEKLYEAVVEGLLGEAGETFDISSDIDGKSAKTRVMIISHDIAHNQTVLNIRLFTGRYHQIRRHFSGIGYPLIGDIRYGAKKNNSGLMLKAYSLSFTCPYLKTKRCFRLP